MEIENPKKRIFDAALQRFSRKGYAATGVRELADAAGVNIAMINYYYGSKLEILKAIITVFFTEYIAIVEKTLTGTAAPDQRIRLFVRGVMAYFRENPELMTIGLTEFPLEVPELAEFKAEYATRVMNLFLRTIFHDLGFTPAMVRIVPVIGPALVGMMAAQFLLRPIIENSSHAEMDDAYYDTAADVIAGIFLNGISELAKSFSMGEQR